MPPPSVSITVGTTGNSYNQGDEVAASQRGSLMTNENTKLANGLYDIKDINALFSNESSWSDTLDAYVVTLSPKDLLKAKLANLKKLTLKRGIANGLKAQEMTKSMHVTCLVRGTSACLNFRENLNPRFMYQPFGLDEWRAVYKNRNFKVEPHILQNYGFAITEKEYCVLFPEAVTSQVDPVEPKAEPFGTTEPLPEVPNIPPIQPQQPQPKAEPAVAANTDAVGNALDVLLKTIINPEQINQMVEDAVVRHTSSPFQFVINDKPMPVMADHYHEVVPDVIKTVASGLPVWLHGKPGAGKTLIAKQVADSLGRDFEYQLCSAELELAYIVGYMLPSGEYVNTQFIGKFEQGNTVICVDEVARALSGVSVGFNTMLSQNRIPLPMRLNKPLAEGGDNIGWVFIDNTKNGVSERYASNAVDKALTDRFHGGFFEVDYDRNLEMKIAQSVDKPQAADIIWTLREALEKELIDEEMGTRQITKAAQLLLNGAEEKWVIDRFLDYFEESEVRKIQPYVNKQLAAYL